MNFIKYKCLVKQITAGKHLPSAKYLHQSALEQSVSTELLQSINQVHIRSGKVTLIKYDDFAGKALPLLTERIKIRLHDLDIDFFDYDDNYPYQPLCDKSHYLAPTSNKQQVSFEKWLSQ